MAATSPTIARKELWEAVERGEDETGDDLALLAVEARRSFSAFVMQLWPVLEPGRDLEWNWHLDVICGELESVVRGEVQELLICVPPGFAKSLLVSVLWPAWWWLRDPTKRFLTLSSSDPLASRDSWRMRLVLTSDRYRRMVEYHATNGARRWELRKDMHAKVSFANDALGSRQCFAIGGSVMGHRGDVVINDDPNQIKDALGSPEQVRRRFEEVANYVETILPSRVNDIRTAVFVTIQQRVHELDTAGRIIRRGTARIVVLPMHFDPYHPQRYAGDPRTEPGELLDPGRFPQESVDILASKLSQFPGQVEAQLEQRPVPPSGGLFKRAWTLRRYTFDPQRSGKAWTEVVLSVDCTFKGTDGTDLVALHVWAREGWANRYLLDRIAAQMSYVDLRQAVRDMHAKWRPDAILIEEKANGAAVLSDLADEVPGLVPFVPDSYGNKYTRAQLSTPGWMAGNYWLPDASIPGCEWVGDFVKYLCAFPLGEYDDDVDAMSQVHLWWRERELSADSESFRADYDAWIRRQGG